MRIRKPLRRLLIANRGEIAIRIAATAAELNIETVGIYSEDDADSLHIKRTDKSTRLNGKGPRAYLDLNQIMDIAKSMKCDAIHPGYGFHSESPEFAALAL